MNSPVMLETMRQNPGPLQPMRILALTSTGHDNIQMLCAKIQESKDLFSCPFNSLAVDVFGLQIFNTLKILKLYNSTV